MGVAHVHVLVLVQVALADHDRGWPVGEAVENGAGVGDAPDIGDFLADTAAFRIGAGQRDVDEEQQRAGAVKAAECGVQPGQIVVAAFAAHVAPVVVLRLHAAGVEAEDVNRAQFHAAVGRAEAVGEIAVGVMVAQQTHGVDGQVAQQVLKPVARAGIPQADVASQHQQVGSEIGDILEIGGESLEAAVAVGQVQGGGEDDPGGAGGHASGPSRYSPAPVRRPQPKRLPGPSTAHSFSFSSSKVKPRPGSSLSSIQPSTMGWVWVSTASRPLSRTSIMMWLGSVAARCAM